MPPLLRQGRHQTLPLDDPGAAGSMPMRRVTSLRGLDALEADWRRLAPEGAAPFQTFGWNRAWYRHYQRDYDEISVLVFFSAGRVTALAPCYRRRNELRLAGDEVCDFQDVVAENPADGPGIVRRILQYAHSRRLTVRLDMLSARGVLWPAIREVADRSETPCHVKTVGPCPWFSLPDDPGGFLGSLRHGRRKQIRRALRRLDEAHPGHRFAIRKGGELNLGDFEEIAGLHCRNQYRKEGGSGFADRIYLNFLSEASESADVGLSLCELRDRSGRLLAFDLGFLCGERFYVYVGSWDAPHEQCSPGVCLLYCEVDELPRHRVRVYDFLRGDEDYKFNYATGSYPVYKATIYPPTPVNQIRVRLLKLLDRVKAPLKPAYRRLRRVIQDRRAALHRRSAGA